jgi:hypothetical protein
LPRAEQVVRGARARRLTAALALASLVFALQACGEDEQDRPLMYDKGSYQGPVDQKLDQDQLDALRQRAARQRI